jgi:hypothetical protein
VEQVPVSAVFAVFDGVQVLLTLGLHRIVDLQDPLRRVRRTALVMQEYYVASEKVKKYRSGPK